MKQLIEIVIPPDFIDDPTYIQRLIYEKLPEAEQKYRIVKRSIDARRKIPQFVLQVSLDSSPESTPYRKPLQYSPVHERPPVMIVGSGPAGYFAALELIEQGIKPIVLEQGEDAHSRRKHITRLLKTGLFDPVSNYCFGEGGAGTFSDGKLYTRSTKRGDVGKILQILVHHGASPDILVDSHPHIGSNRLPTIVKRIRETILTSGGEVRFNTKVTGFLLCNNSIKGLRLSDDSELESESVILATGHSARGIYRGLYDSGILIEPKPLAIGVRVEHPQELIDAMCYHHSPRHPNLPAATYRLTSQCAGRGVYSFCMCPGGYIVPTVTEANSMAINGMSFSGRKGRFANAGVVVELGPEDLDDYRSEGPFAMMAFQEDIERKTFEMGGGIGQIAPAQRMTDFIDGKISPHLPETSYLPGITSAPLHELFPPAVTARLRQAFGIFNRKLKGYLTNEALLVAVESRTSAPVRIPRHPVTFMHPQVSGLFPCGEGAGYAGGIVSSAIDGQVTAQRVATWIDRIE